MLIVYIVSARNLGWHSLQVSNSTHCYIGFDLKLDEAKYFEEFFDRILEKNPREWIFKMG